MSTLTDTTHSSRWKGVYLHPMEPPLIHAAICVGGALASYLVPDSWKLPLNHRIDVEGIAVHYAIIGRNELGHSAQPRLQQK